MYTTSKTGTENLIKKLIVVYHETTGTRRDNVTTIKHNTSKEIGYIFIYPSTAQHVRRLFKTTLYFFRRANFIIRFFMALVGLIYLTLT